MPSGPSYQSAVTSGFNSWRLSNFGMETDITVTIDSSARDSGATPTTKLRAGLVLGKITASGKYKEYDNAASDGSQTAVGILANDVLLIDAAGTAQDVPGTMAMICEVDSGNLIGYDANALADFEAAGKNTMVVVRNSTAP